MNYVMWFLYKSLNMAIFLIYFNTINGFSASTIFDDIYYAGYMVQMTTVAIGAYLFID